MVGRYRLTIVYLSLKMKRILLGLLLLILIGGGVVAYVGYQWILADNIKDTDKGYVELYVGHNWTYDSVTTALYDHLKDFSSFDRIARKMNLPANVIPGKYVLPDSLGNRALVTWLRSGKTQDVKVIINGSLKRYSILAEIARNLEVDSIELANLINNKSFIDSLGYNAENWPCMFLANTYRFNWATSARGVIKRFTTESKSFWTPEREARASNLGLNHNEVIILASIVDAETMVSSEMPRIAGVYLNRLQQDWPLGADPTIRYIINDEGRQRVLYADLEIEHPYNTYKNLGLPPGPILLPSIDAINAVLNAESHSYMFFCAKADFSGYHEFSKTNAQHERYRAAYRRALNQRGIMR